MNTELDWLILGAGPHGLHLALALLHRHRVPRRRLALLDPYPELAWRWRHTTTNCGMRYLRSAVDQHIDLDQGSLRQFIRRRCAPRDAYAPDARQRPTLALFQAHLDAVLTRHDLAALHHRGRATAMAALPGGGWRVETAQGGVIEARRVVVALGFGQRPKRPAWARGVAHLFDDDLDRASLRGLAHVIVIGGGISAAQVAITLSAQDNARVSLLSRHALRVHELDADAGWLGHDTVEDFARASPSARAKMLSDSKRPGSLPSALLERLRESPVDLVQGSVAHHEPPGSVVLADGRALSAERVILATGYDEHHLPAPLDALDLPRAPCGRLLLDATLRAGPDLFVSGQLAELELGAMARNLMGARLAAMRLNLARLQGQL